MQNKLFTLLCTGLLAFALTSCDKDESSDSTKLAAPVLSVTEQTSNGFTVSWQTVENAAGYAYVFEKEAEKSTNATSVTFTDLEPGTYTVKVKATSGSAEFSDSNYASISATVENDSPSEEMTFTLEVSDITDSSATISSTPSDNTQTYLLNYTTKSVFDQLHTSDEAFTNALIQTVKEIAAEAGMTLEAVLNELLSSGPATMTADELTGSTEYVAYAFGLTTDGTVTSAVSTKTFTTDESVLSPEAEKWLGEWDATSTGRLVWSENGQSMGASYDQNTPMELKFTISYEQGQLLLYGWSQVDGEIPALCDVNENGELEVYAGVTVGAASDGFTPTWAAYSIMNGSQYTLVTGSYPAYTFSMDGDNITCKRYEGNLSNGGTFQALSLEIYALSDTQFSIYAQTLPVYYVAGDITLKKAAAASNSEKIAATFKSALKPAAAKKMLRTYSSVMDNMRAM